MRPSHRAGPARLRLMLAAPTLVVIVAACSTAVGAPGYTYAPPSSSAASSPMGMGPSGSAAPPSVAPVPSSPASAGPASAPPDPTGSAAPIGATEHISARNIQFDTDQLEAPAGQSWTLAFDNNDPGIPHNVEILDATGASVFRGDVVTGPAKVSYQVPALAAGQYTFLCDVHPTMTGTLTVR
jgi:plastocyanin